MSAPCAGPTRHGSFGLGGRTAPRTEWVTQKGHIRSMGKVRPSVQGEVGQKLHLRMFGGGEVLPTVHVLELL